MGQLSATDGRSARFTLDTKGAPRDENQSRIAEMRRAAESASRCRRVDDICGHARGTHRRLACEQTACCRLLRRPAVFDRRPGSRGRSHHKRFPNHVGACVGAGSRSKGALSAPCVAAPAVLCFPAIPATGLSNVEHKASVPEGTRASMFAVTRAASRSVARLRIPRRVLREIGDR